MEFGRSEQDDQNIEIVSIVKNSEYLRRYVLGFLDDLKGERLGTELHKEVQNFKKLKKQLWETKEAERQ